MPFSIKKEPGLLQEMAYYSAGPGKIQGEPEHLEEPKSAHKTTGWLQIRGRRANLKELPTAEAGTI